MQDMEDMKQDTNKRRRSGFLIVTAVVALVSTGVSADHHRVTVEGKWKPQGGYQGQDHDSVAAVAAA